MVDDQGLAAFLLGEPKDEPTNVADPKMAEHCKNAHLDCGVIGSSANSLNAHARFCNFEEEKAKPAAAPKATKAVKAVKATKTNAPVGASREAARKSKRTEANSADDENPKKAHARPRCQATRKSEARAAAQQRNVPFDVEEQEDDDFAAKEQAQGPAMAKQVRLIVAGGVVVIVLVQIKSLGKALAKAQRELARVVAANKGLREATGQFMVLG